MSTTPNRSTPMHNDGSPSAIGRRGLLFGSVGLAGLVLAACKSSEAGEIGRIGEGPTTPKLKDAVVNNGVLLRTMAGIETSIAAAYERIAGEGLLAGTSATLPSLGDQGTLITTFARHHTAAAATFNELATAEGEAAWECGNTRLDNAFLDVIFERVLEGRAKTDSSTEIAASDDIVRDMANLVYVLESLSAESCQALVPQVSTPEIRMEAMKIGTRSARQAALIALHINPGGYVPSSVTDAEPTTTGPASGPAATPIPLPSAVPSRFCSLAPITYIGGAGDENGVRLKLNFETPSLNSLAYPDDACA